MEFPEDQEKSLIKLAYLGSMFEEKPKLDFIIDEHFSLRNELIEMLGTFGRCLHRL